MVVSALERRCLDCSAVLSRYNSGMRCAPCDERHRRQEEAEAVAVDVPAPTRISRRARRRVDEPKRGPGGALRSGEWSVLYDCCVLCGRADSPHASKGRCRRCWDIVRRGGTVQPGGGSVLAHVQTVRRLRVTLADIEAEIDRLQHLAARYRAALTRELRGATG